MPLKFQHPHDTEVAARAQARGSYATVRVQIIESRGKFYLEDADTSGFIRNWEREVYSGYGRNA